MESGVLFGMGNPLLDLSVTVDTSVLQRYGLKENDAILAEDKHMSLYDEVSRCEDVEYIPGGATQNAIKVAQWMLQQPGACVFTGCIKDDEYGKILDESCRRIGVRTAYQYHTGQESTGRCACLINGHNRSLVTHLGAACKFTVDHLSKPEIWQLVENAKFFYVSSFFVTSCHEALMRVARHAAEAKKVFSLNFGAPFLVEFFTKEVVEALEWTDLLFCNESEALKYAEVQKLGTTDVNEIALAIERSPYHNTHRRRTVIITQGADPVIVVHNGVLTTFPVTLIDRNDIVDTNGAGDAFAGGFLAAHIKGRSVEDCVATGQLASRIIIQRSGCTFPDKPPSVI